VTGVEIRAMDSIDPPRGRRITITDDQGIIIDEPLPRFHFPSGGMTPVGDWDIDENAPHGTVWRRQLAITGAFTVAARFKGRFHHDLEVVLLGEQAASVAFRRGLINHDVFIRASDGAKLAVTSIDPTPLADIGSILAIVMRAMAVACLLIGLFSFIASRSRPSPRPAAEPRWMAAPWAWVLALSAAAFSIWVARDVLECLPHLPDSVTYLVQARWLLDGDLWKPLSAIQEHLDIPYTYVVGERWLAHYPPGWPLLLSFGLAIGLPWLVAPVLGAVFVILLYATGREIDGPVTGLLAATLGLLSPQVRLIFGSLLSHAAAATLVLAAVYLLILARNRGSYPFAPLSGAALGLVFGIRPLTAVAAALPLAALAVGDCFSRRERDSKHRLVSWSIGGAVMALPTLAANHLITGNLLGFPYSLADGSMYFASNWPFGVRNLDIFLYSSGSMLHGWGWPQFHGVLWVAVALSFSLLPFLLRKATTADVLLAAVSVVSALAYLGSRGHGLHGFGPRYLFETYAFVLLLSARGFVELGRVGTNAREGEMKPVVAASTLLFFTLTVTAAVALPYRLGLYRGYNGIDGSLKRQIREQRVDRAVVLLDPADWRGWAMAAPLMEPDPGAGLLFIQAEPGDPAVSDVARGRPVFTWRDGRLVAVRTTRGDARIEALGTGVTDAQRAP
jgi:hypothetical protein